MNDSAPTYHYSDNLDQMDFERVHRWLAGTYWSPEISRDKVEKGARNSTVVGVFAPAGEQVGFARCVSDTTRFAYVADVFVDEAHRKRGLARELVRFLMRHEKLRDVESWYLFTRDAHGVYAPLGFRPSDNPERLMVYKKSEHPSTPPAP